MFPSVAASLS